MPENMFCKNLILMWPFGAPFPIASSSKYVCTYICMDACMCIYIHESLLAWTPFWLGPLVGLHPLWAKARLLAEEVASPGLRPTARESDFSPMLIA